MRKIFTLGIFLLCTHASYAQTTIVLPSGFSSTAGGSTFTGPLSTAGRSYQLVIDSSLLTTLIGSQITGLTFRSSASASTTWPTSQVTVTDYDIYMGPAVPIASGSTTFANNQTGTQTQVRSGGLTLAAGAFPAGGTSSWGPVITFTSPYTYNGGNLNILIRQSGAGSNRAVDAVGTSVSGYGTLFRAAWGSGITSSGGSQGNFAVTQLTYTLPLSIVLSNFRADRDGDDAILRWITQPNESIVHFTIEKSYNGRNFSELGIVYASSNSETHEYQFRDVNLKDNFSPAAFYRLRLLKENGEISYSHVAQVSTPSGSALLLAPNPATQILNARFDVKNDQSVSYYLTDISGRIVLSGTNTAPRGVNELRFDVSSLPAGPYTFLLKTTAGNLTSRFIKQ